MSFWKASITGQSYAGRIYHIHQIRAPVWLDLICPWNNGRSARKSHNWIEVNYWSGKWNLHFRLKTLTKTLKMGNCWLQLKHLSVTYVWLWWQQWHFKVSISHVFEGWFFRADWISKQFSISKPVRLFKTVSFNCHCTEL